MLLGLTKRLICISAGDATLQRMKLRSIGDAPQPNREQGDAATAQRSLYAAR